MGAKIRVFNLSNYNSGPNFYQIRGKAIELF